MNNEVKNIIIKSFGIEAASPEVQEELISQIGALIFQGSLMRAMERVEEKDLEKFETILNNNADPDMIFAFLVENIPGFEQIVAEEALAFKEKANQTMANIGN